MLTKTIKSDVKDIDEKSNTVIVYYSAFGNKDRAGDIIVPTAFNKTIKDRGPNGSDEIWHLFNHVDKMVSGKPTELTPDDYGLKAVVKLLGTTNGKDAKEMYKAGVIKHHSIGYSIIREEQKSTYNELQELRLYEGSHVLWPANPKATTQSVDLKSLKLENIQEYEELLKNFYYFCRNSNATDEMIGIIENQSKELNKLLQELKSTLPPNRTKPQPLSDAMIDSLNKFNNLF